ncbi:MAG: hypothetical protein QHH30_04285 [candidate division NC10 bacterium]|nr:hypothetical protein [candidate division NC10 bacterium]
MEQEQKAKAEKTKDLERLTTTKLRELALEKYPQIRGVHGMKKEELVAAIKAVEIELGIREKEEEKKPPRQEIKKKVKREKKVVTLPEAKAKLKELKGQREGALASQDRKALQEVRFKIKKLKRLMRRLKEAS